MDNKLFVIDKSGKALRKVFFHFENGLNSWVNQD
jgi:hypothetical protein